MFLRFKAILLLGLLSSAAAQTPDTAIIRGRIIDQTGGAVSNAEISLTNTATGLRRSARSGDSGTFQLAGLPLTGGYQLTIAKDGFASEQPPPLELRGDEIATVDVTLKPAGAQSSVTVIAAAQECGPIRRTSPPRSISRRLKTPPSSAAR